MGYAAAAGLAVGQALIGPSAEFALPFLLLVGYQASVHPARRLLPLLGWVVLLETASNLVGSTAAVDVAQVVSGIVLLVLITAMALIHAESNRSLAGRLSFVALHDGLTGLPNRALVIDRAGQILARARRQHRPVAAFYIDLDGFKRINDTYGHAAGDQLLCVVAARLSGVIRDADTVGATRRR
jgi:predicted signal transduction protein with EAL and GGDEF domain